MRLQGEPWYWTFPLVLVLGACAPQNSAVVPPTKPVNGTSAVSGSVTVTPNCGGNTAQIMLVTGNQVLYQTAVRNGGTFEFQAVPGTYTIIGQTQNGCFTQQSVTLNPNQTTTTSVGLMNPAPSVAMQPGATQPGGYPPGGYPPPPGTSPYPTAGYPPPPGGYPNGNCAYGGYGCPTGYYSCPWGGAGCYGGYYPGAGGAVAGKPNVYFSGPAGMKLSVRLLHPDDSNVLAAVPIHGSGGWSGTLGADGSLNSGKAKYPYFYYDLRFNPDRIQSQKGYCVEKTALLPSLLSYLRQAGFKANEVADFQEYWSARMPPAKHYCVYPQEHPDIVGAADLEIDPKPDQVTRVWFFITAKEEDAQKTAAMMKKFSGTKYASAAEKWLKKPPTEIAMTPRRGTPGRGLASQASTSTPTRFEVREWGVGFLVQPGDGK